MASTMAAVAGARGIVGGLGCEAHRTGKKQERYRVGVVKALSNEAGFRALKWQSSSISGVGAPGFKPSRPLPTLHSSRSALVVAAAVERSYIMIKPDGVQRGLVGEIISRFERKGFTLKGLKLFQTSEELAKEHYSELKEKPFFPSLVEYIISGPVVCMVWEGPGVVASARKLIGVTNPLNAEPGTIRGDFGLQSGRNVIHGSDSPANGEREIALWFKEGEVVEWTSTITPWIIEK